MFGTSGIRGPVGETVTADLALRVGRALGVDSDRVVVGRDPRDSGDLLADALAAGLRESGTDVLDAGLAATPTVARAVGWHGADAGVVVTASHNPAPDNGIKLWQPSGQAFDADLRETMTERIEGERADLADWDALGDRTAIAPAERHVEALVGAVESEAVADTRVAVDLGNGAGGVTVDALGALGASVETLNAQPDGRFPGRPSEPTAEHCASLTALVREGEAEIGIAHDGDADRLRAATSEGFVSGDDLLAVFAREAAATNGSEASERASGDTQSREAAATSGSEASKVAVPVDTSLAVADHLADAGVEVTYTPVGDVHVAAAASEAGVAFGGEPSGAWIWPGETLCPDGPLAACKLLALHAERPLAKRVADVPDYPIYRDSVAVEDKHGVMDRVDAAVAERFADVQRLDGVRVDLDAAWFLVRASGTQPLVRITAEARESERAREAFETARELVERGKE